MSLRTIRFWALYDPGNKVIVEQRKLKRDIQKVRRRYPNRLVVVKLTGNYVSSVRGGGDK